LSVEDAKWFRISRLRQAALKKVARDRRDDPNFNWRKLAYYCANEKRQFPPGLYIGPGLPGVQVWPGAHVASILYHGKNPIFGDDELAPPYIVRAIHDGKRQGEAAEN
jgi:hypothetical protein